MSTRGAHVQQRHDYNSSSAGGGVYADPSGQPAVLIGTEVKRNKGGDIFGGVIQL
jgi:hypothetical protein